MSLFKKAKGPKDEEMLKLLLSRNREQAAAAEGLLFSKYQKLAGKGDQSLSKEEREQAYESAFLDFIKSLPHQGERMLEEGGLGAVIERFFETAQREMLWARAIRSGQEPACTEAAQALMLQLAPLKNSLKLRKKWGGEVVDDAFLRSCEELLKKVGQDGVVPSRSLIALFKNIFKYRLLDAYGKEKKSASHNPAALGPEAVGAPAEYERASVFNQFEAPLDSQELLIAERLRAFLDHDNFHLLEQLSREAQMAVKGYWSDLLSDLASLIKALKKMKLKEEPCLDLLLMRVEKRSFREIYSFLEQKGLLKETTTDETSRKNLVNSRIRRCRDSLYEQLEPVFNLVYRKKKDR